MLLALGAVAGGGCRQVITANATAVAGATMTAEAATAAARPTATPTATATVAPTATSSPTLAPSATATTAPTATSSATATLTATWEPTVTLAAEAEAGGTMEAKIEGKTTPDSRPTAMAATELLCLQPPDDYERVSVEGHELNGRTLAMLQAAKQIYPGPGDLLRVTQGSYRDELAASFGTHAGGGAVDISIRDPNTPELFLYDEVEAMVSALRYAGFAAWFRRPGDLGPDSAAHIHAIAIGDRELSEAALEQVVGDGGYLNGMDGLIAPWGPNPDRHGGPVICEWMEALE